MRPRRSTRWLLFLFFVVLPIVEIYLLVQVGQAVGALWAILLVIAGCLAGSWVIQHEGRKTRDALRAAVSGGGTPAKEVADAILVLVGGILLVLPGLISDAVAVLLILPFTRPLFRGVLASAVATRLVTPPGTARHPGSGPEGPVVRGEVIDE